MSRDYEASYAASVWDAGFLAWRTAGAHQKAMNIQRICSGIKTRSVIEIGCGTGAVLSALYRMNFAEQYACTDLSFSAMQFVRQSCKDVGQRAVVSQADGLPFPNDIFDVAILTHVIEHLDEPFLAVREASRVARFLVIEVPTEKVLSNMIRTRILRRQYASIEGAGHLQFWSPKSIETFLADHCELRILEHHCDLLSESVEFHNKKGLQLVKPVFKQGLKAILPDPVYSRLLTTHATFLCTRSETRAKNDIGTGQKVGSS